MDRDEVASALESHRAYMLALMNHDRDRASEIYGQMSNRHPIQIVELTRCATILRHGLFRGRLTANDYDLASTLCQSIEGGNDLVPFLSRIKRVGRWAA